MAAEEKISYRRTRHADLVPASRMVVATVNNLFKRNNRPQMKFRVTRPWPPLVHWLGTDGQGSYVAVNEKGRIVGFVMSVVREEEWYLADLFVRRSYQSRGIGAKLLQKAMRYGRDNNCKRWSLCTFSINEQAVAAYAKVGMTPQRPILSLGRSLAGNPPPPKLAPDVELSYRELSDDKWINRLVRIDRKARGIRRPEEHFFWLRDSQYHLRLFQDGRRTAGFTVASNWGAIGPIVATDPAYLWSLLCYTVNISRSPKMKLHNLHVPGEKKEMVQQLLKAGFRIRQVLLEVGTEKLADLSIYIPGDLAHF
jgi:GNAT superfamily N-acetyltransferase